MTGQLIFARALENASRQAALSRPGRAGSAGRIVGGAEHHDRTAGHVDCRPAGQHRSRTACTGAGSARRRRRVDDNMPAVCVIGARQDEPHGVVVGVEEQQEMVVADRLAAGTALGNGVTVQEHRMPRSTSWSMRWPAAAGC